MAKSNLKLTTVLAVSMGLSLACYSLPASAGGKPGNGPQASVDVATTCVLNGTSLDVAANVTNKDLTKDPAVIDSYSITPVYTAGRGRDSSTGAVAPAVGSDTDAPVPAGGVTITASFALCDALMSLPTDLRALNADVNVTYGMDDGTGAITGDLKSVMNRCDGGIKVSYDELATACAAP
jgi:hypothetical protein